jgi:hypothetical protein
MRHTTTEDMAGADHRIARRRLPHRSISSARRMARQARRGRGRCGDAGQGMTDTE